MKKRGKMEGRKGVATFKRPSSGRTFSIKHLLTPYLRPGASAGCGETAVPVTSPHSPAQCDEWWCFSGKGQGTNQPSAGGLWEETGRRVWEGFLAEVALSRHLKCQ